MLILAGSHNGDSVALVRSHLIRGKSATRASVLNPVAARDAIFKAVLYVCETGVAH